MTGPENRIGARKRPPLARIGEPINPYNQFLCAPIPLGVLEDPKLTHGAKLLYGRLMLFSGKDGQCNPSNQTLAKKLAVSPDSITRWLGELRRQGYITTKFNGQGGTPDHTFRMHTNLLESMKNTVESADLRSECQTGALSPQICGIDSGNLRRQASAKTPSAYKEETIQIETIHETTSSFGGDSVAEAEPEQPIESTTTNALSVSETELEPIPFEHARETLRRLRHGREREAVFGSSVPITTFPLPDATITNQIIGGRFFRDRSDFDTWAEAFDADPRKFRNPGYGLLLADARSWPDNRASYQPSANVTEPELSDHDDTARRDAWKKRVAEQAQRVAQCEAKGWRRHSIDTVKHCDDCHGYGRILETEEYCACANGAAAKADDERKAARDARCPHCGGDGYLETGQRPDGIPPDSLLQFIEFCGCEHGERAKASQPDRVEKHNAFVRKDAIAAKLHAERKAKEEQREEANRKRRSTGLGSFVTPGQMLTSACSGGWEMRA